MVNEIFPPYEDEGERHGGLYRFACSLHALWKSDKPRPHVLKMFLISQYESARCLSVRRLHRASGFFA
jgi:hypothetical protein